MRRLLNGAGIAALVLYPMYQTASLRSWSMRMHSPLALTDFALAMLVNMAVVTLIVAVLCKWIEDTRLGDLIRTCLPALYAAAAVEGIFLYETDSNNYKYFLRVLVLALLLIWALRLFWPAAYRWVEEVRRAFAVGLVAFCLVVVVQLVRLVVWRPAPNMVENSLAADPQPAASHPRVIWILMDELSYNQVFGQRFPGLELPNFDALRQVSTVFTNVAPVTEQTETAVPSLLEGQPVSAVSDTSDNHVLLTIHGQPPTPFLSPETPFAEAKQLGMTTGVVGWYNPYCSMLAPYLDQCYWTYQALQPAVFLVGDGFWRDLEDTWIRYAIVIYPRLRQRLLNNQAKVYEDLNDRAKQALENNQLDFVFLHLPLPHPPGFYNRRTGQFDASGNTSYIDNLALSDKTLGELLTTLHASPRWPETSIVVCGDHSWRTYLWKASGHWTAEDRAASHGGVFDPRPMLMVHGAGQSSADTIGRPVPLLKVHDIVDGLLRSQQPQLP